MTKKSKKISFEIELSVPEFYFSDFCYFFESEAVYSFLNRCSTQSYSRKTFWGGRKFFDQIFTKLNQKWLIYEVSKVLIPKIKVQYPI